MNIDPVVAPEAADWFQRVAVDSEPVVLTGPDSERAVFAPSGDLEVWVWGIVGRCGVHNVDDADLAHRLVTLYHQGFREEK